jgi:hypothetical protein
MIITELYNGQGLGNQLWCYVVTRTIALDKGFDFGIMSAEKFKGKAFLDLDFGKEVKGGQGPEGGPPITLPDGITNYFVEKNTWYERYKCDIRDYDPTLIRISDNSKIELGIDPAKKILDRRNSQYVANKQKSEFCDYHR